MFQRIQSLYLILTMLLSLLFQSFDILRIVDPSDQSIGLNLREIFTKGGSADYEIYTELLILLSVSALITIISFIALLFFKRRVLQLKMIKILIALEFCLMAAAGYLVYILLQNAGLKLSPVISSFIPILTLVFSFLAYSGIKKDEELVRSSDRLR